MRSHSKRIDDGTTTRQGQLCFLAGEKGLEKRTHTATLRPWSYSRLFAGRDDSNPVIGKPAEAASLDRNDARKQNISSTSLGEKDPTPSAELT